MLFDEQFARKPNLYPWTQDFINAIWAGHWTPNEFNFKGDYAQFKSELTEPERRIVVKTLSAIGQVEIAVKRFWAQLGDNLPQPAMYDLGYALAATEVIHNQAYEKLLDTLRLGKVFEENLKEPALAGRFEYLKKYLKKVYKLDHKKQYIYALILFTLFVENVSLFSQFYIILWFNRFKNTLKDTAQQVQYTRNEEALHAQVGIKLINTLRAEYPELFDPELIERIVAEVQEAYTAESKMIDWIIGDYTDENISAEILKNYVANRLNDSLKAIKVKHVLPVDKAVLRKSLWMDEELIGNNMSDFFHHRPTEYAKKNKSFKQEDIFE